MVPGVGQRQRQRERGVGGVECGDADRSHGGAPARELPDPVPVFADAALRVHGVEERLRAEDEGEAEGLVRARPA
ncbi:hypothetical protein [Streptomyces griseoruber]|uniref:hypothetical protein n=1 Tax=Streptomyces griseoruber TaxID=1943 RepID=UPI0037A5B7EA